MQNCHRATALMDYSRQINHMGNNDRIEDLQRIGRSNIPKVGKGMHE